MIHGLGSQIHLLSLAASYAEEFGAKQTLVKVHATICQDRLEAVVTRRFVLSLAGRTLLVLDQDEWWFTDGAVCPSRSWSCHFKALSSCSADADDLGAFVCCSPDKTINMLQLSR